MTLGQTISPGDAAKLPASVTGAGDEVTEKGAQTVLIRVYAPFGGSIGDFMIDGKRVQPAEKESGDQGSAGGDSRTALSTREDVVITWQMTTGDGQTADGQLGLTPALSRGTTTKSLPVSADRAAA